MSVKERILALKLMEKAHSNPEIARDFEIRSRMVKRTKDYNQVGNQKKEIIYEKLVEQSTDQRRY